MIDLHTYKSPNSYKASICLEELELPYRVILVDLSKGDQKSAEFLALNPNGKVPVIVDHDTDQVIFESGAILLYLADKAGRLIPAHGNGRWDVIKWLFLHSAVIGPSLGQRVNFSIFAEEKVPSVIDHFTRETERLFSVINAQLINQEYLCGAFSIADIANFGWLHIANLIGFSFGKFDALSEWYERVAARPAVARGILVPAPADGP